MATETPQESSVNMVSHMDLNKTACKIIASLSTTTNMESLPLFVTRLSVMRSIETDSQRHPGISSGLSVPFGLFVQL